MPRKQSNIHYIYKTTCNVTNKYYIGMHSTSNIDDGYLGSGKRLRRSIRKYGKENHTKEILEYCQNREELAARERELITEEHLSHYLCMNLMSGGTGGFVSIEASRRGAKATHLKVKNRLENDVEFRKKMYAVLTENRIKAAKAGKFKGNKSFTDKSHSTETKALMRKAKIGKYTGCKNSQFGTMWVTKNNINKKIFIEQFTNFEENGWIKGRVI